MGQSAELVVEVEAAGGTPTPIVDALLAAGWELGEGDGTVLVLPLGDDGDYGWERLPLAPREPVLELLRERARRGEVVGASMVWAGTQVGGICRIREGSTLRFDPDIRRPTECGRTDVRWILARVLAIDGACGVRVVRWTWSES